MTRRERVEALFVKAYGKRKGPRMLRGHMKLVFGPKAEPSMLGPDEWRFLAQCAEGVLRENAFKRRQKARQYYWRKKRAREGWGV
ncbi:MAG TPA: hypothetical protein ENJ40_03475 [Thermosulfurimonas dismutans]|uniref:Uncharacterized protein n=1 Tax=Thermosulfurimonas dismutans TaxID=999894 RepID=A0A7C3CFN9_9BACT|nr:hypothetical protein [Thermosulfurimonas dismutans]